MIIIVCGPRDWTDKLLVHQALDDMYEKHSIAWEQEYGRIEASFTKSLDEILQPIRDAFVIRHGVGGNVDFAANDWAIARKCPVERFPAQWKDSVTGQTDFSAGPRRNRFMAQAQPRADLCLAFWDGKFTKRGGREVSGTFNMITEALAAGINVNIKPPRTP